MKKIIWIIAILTILIMPSVVAYEGMEIEWIKIYVNDERKSGADEDGGDFNAYAGDEVKIIAKFFNHNNTVTEVEMEATMENIDDGDDIVKEHDWFDVDDDDDTSKEFNFLIPKNAMKDDYDLVLEITYRYNNGTQEKLKDIDWEMTIRDESTSTKKINLESSFDNLTNICGDVVVGLNNCFGYINQSDTCTDELSTCKQERGVCVESKATLTTDFKECTDERIEFEKRVQEKENEMSNMIKKDDAKKDLDEAVREKEKDMQQLGIILALVAAGGFMMWKKKAEGQDLPKQYYKDQG